MTDSSPRAPRRSRSKLLEAPGGWRKTMLSANRAGEEKRDPKNERFSFFARSAASPRECPGREQHAAAGRVSQPRHQRRAVVVLPPSRGTNKRVGLPAVIRCAERRWQRRLALCRTIARCPDSGTGRFSNDSRAGPARLSEELRQIWFEGEPRTAVEVGHRPTEGGPRDLRQLPQRH